MRGLNVFVGRLVYTNRKEVGLMRKEKRAMMLMLVLIKQCRCERQV